MFRDLVVCVLRIVVFVCVCACVMHASIVLYLVSRYVIGAYVFRVVLLCVIVMRAVLIICGYGCWIVFCIVCGFVYVCCMFVCV